MRFNWNQEVLAVSCSVRWSLRDGKKSFPWQFSPHSSVSVLHDDAHAQWQIPANGFVLYQLIYKGWTCIKESVFFCIRLCFIRVQNWRPNVPNFPHLLAFCQLPWVCTCHRSKSFWKASLKTGLNLLHATDAVVGGVFMKSCCAAGHCFKLVTEKDIVQASGSEK